MATKKGENTPTISGKSRSRKSDQLTKAELARFQKKANKAKSFLDVSEALEITEATRRSIYRSGFGSPATVQKVRAYINQ